MDTETSKLENLESLTDLWNKDQLLLQIEVNELQSMHSETLLVLVLV